MINTAQGGVGLLEKSPWLFAECLAYLQNAYLGRCHPVGLEESSGVSQAEEEKEGHVLAGVYL